MASRTEAHRCVETGGGEEGAKLGAGGEMSFIVKSRWYRGLSLSSTTTPPLRKPPLPLPRGTLLRVVRSTASCRHLAIMHLADEWRARVNEEEIVA